jgi:hypothetical protein
MPGMNYRKQGCGAKPAVEHTGSACALPSPGTIGKSAQPPGSPPRPTPSGEDEHAGQFSDDTERVGETGASTGSASTVRKASVTSEPDA